MADHGRNARKNTVWSYLFCFTKCVRYVLNISANANQWKRSPMVHIVQIPQIDHGSNNGLSPFRRQTIIYTNAGLLLIRPLGTKFNEILIKIQNFLFTKMLVKISSAKWRPFCPGEDVVNIVPLNKHVYVVEIFPCGR